MYCVCEYTTTLRDVQQASKRALFCSQNQSINNLSTIEKHPCCCFYETMSSGPSQARKVINPSSRRLYIKLKRVAFAVREFPWSLPPHHTPANHNHVEASTVQNSPKGIDRTTGPTRKVAEGIGMRSWETATITTQGRRD